MSELKPCPFCGSANVKLRTNPYADMSWVSCIDCGLEAPSETGVSAEQAVEYWNRRAALETPANPIEEVADDQR